MIRDRRTIGILMVTMAMVLALVAVSCAPEAPPGEGEKTIKVGLSLTTTGPIATAGAPNSLGLLDYLKYINEELGGIEYNPAPGEVDRVKLDVIWEDNAYNIPKTLSIYKRQQAAGVDLMGILGSTPGEAIAALASRDSMPIVGTYASASPVNLGAEPNYYMATIGNAAEQAGAVLKWFEQTWTEQRQPRVATLFVDIPSLRPVAYPEGTPAYAAKLGMDWVGAEWHPMAVTDVTIELTRLMNQGVDLVVLGGVIGNTVVVMKDALRLGAKDKMTFAVAVTSSYDDTLVGLAPEAVEGLYGIVPVTLVDDDVPGVRLAREVTEKYRPGKELTLVRLEGIFSGMVIIEGLKQAVEEVGYENLTGPVINEALHTIKDFDSGGIIPSLTVDPDYPMFMPSVKMTMIEGGTVKAVSEWYEYPAIREIMPDHLQR